MQMRATHRVEGRLAVEVAPEVFALAGDDDDDRLTACGTLWKAGCSIEEYDGEDTVEVSDEQLARAPEASAMTAAASRRLRAEIMEKMKYRSTLDD